MDLDTNKLPLHIGIIMDGNRRWAKARNLPAKMGHNEGAKNVREMCKIIKEIGVKYLTLFAFSTENWKREKEEVDEIMKLLREFLDECIQKIEEEKVKIIFLGERLRLDEDIIAKMNRIEKETEKYEGLCLAVAINYGGRDEIIRAIKRLENVKDITEEEFEKYLDTSDMPSPDLIIRTSGEERLSNFLIWQGAYSELYFASEMWPDFKRPALIKALDAYAKRNRRFGGK